MQILPSSVSISFKKELPLWLSWLRILPQFRRPGFNLWVGKIPWRGERLPTPVFWSGEFHGLYSSWGCRESDMTQRLSFTSRRKLIISIQCVPAWVLCCSFVCDPMDYMWPAGLLCLWDFPSKNTGVGCHFLLQEIFPDPGIKLASPALADGLFATEPPGKPI